MLSQCCSLYAETTKEFPNAQCKTTNIPILIMHNIRWRRRRRRKKEEALKLDLKKKLLSMLLNVEGHCWNHQRFFAMKLTKVFCNIEAKTYNKEAAAALKLVCWRKKESLLPHAPIIQRLWKEEQPKNSFAVKIDKRCCSNESIKYNKEEAAALKLMWWRKKLLDILLKCWRLWKSKPKNFVAIIVKSITYNEEESAAALKKLVWWRTYLEALLYASQMLKVDMAEILQPQWQIDKCCNIDKQNILVTKKKMQLWSLLMTKNLFPIYASGFQRLCWNQGRRICWSWFIVYTLAK